MKLEIESEKVGDPKEFHAKKHIRGVRLHFIPESNEGSQPLYEGIVFEKEKWKGEIVYEIFVCIIECVNVLFDFFKVDHGQFYLSVPRKKRKTKNTSCCRKERRREREIWCLF